MIVEQTDSPDKVSIVNKSPTTLTSTGGLVTAVPNSPNRSTVRFSPFSFAGAKTAHIGVYISEAIYNFKIVPDKLEESNGNLKLTGIPSNKLPSWLHNILGSALSSQKKRTQEYLVQLVQDLFVKRISVVIKNKLYIFSSSPLQLFIKFIKIIQILRF